VIVPENLSAAANYNCLRCLTYALASQLVLTLDGPLSSDSMARLNALWQEIAAYGNDLRNQPLSEIQGRLSAYKEQIMAVIKADPSATPAGSAGTVTTPGVTSGATTGATTGASPGSTQAPSPGAGGSGATAPANGAAPTVGTATSAPGPGSGSDSSSGATVPAEQQPTQPAATAPAGSTAPAAGTATPVPAGTAPPAP
jgi:putative peptide zinc metalloprotease protein